VEVRFGTDGIRGVANVELSADLALALGRAVADVLPASAVVVGRDTRRSGPMLQAAVTAGLASRGVDVVDVGVLPTPAVAWAAARRELPAVMVSASHNPFTDNGLKVFATGGRKLDDQAERALEQALQAELHGVTGDGDDPGARRSPRGVVEGTAVGAVTEDPDLVEGWIAATVGVLGGRRLDGMRIALDCANGAAYRVAPEVLRRLGADLVVVGDGPDGTNINDGCGSTHPERLAAVVLQHGTELGLALDGDADRLLAVDHHGRVVSGDHLLALFATDLRDRGELVGDTVVVTVMSNLGLRLALADAGIAVRETPVGDRYVLEVLDAEGLVLGGEQSGHLVFRSLATTGDGTLTGVLLADLVRRRGRPLAELADAAMTPVPQHLVNVAARRPGQVAVSDDVVAARAAAEAILGDRGRVLVRASGTEAVVRVMVEAVDADVAQQVLDDLCAAVTKAAAAD
jgi:phosphoglucosamine mutase